MTHLNLAATIDRALRSAGFAPGAASGPAVAIRDTIDRALEAAGLKSPEPAPAAAGKAPLPLVERLDVPDPATTARPPAAAAPAADTPSAERRTAAPATGRPFVPRPGPAPGRIVRHHHVGPAGARDYRLYVPANRPPGRVPLVMMLHGCRQDPDDFARGTRMDALAEEAGCLVVYPAQTSRANGSNCWNWFQPGDQRRDHGEPAILAAIVRELVDEWPIDPARVFVAGLSAGASMAVILGRTHPDVFAAVGAHSGLPYAAAQDVGSAFGAMRSGPSEGASAASAATPVPTIVFHGDADPTVSAANGEAIAAQALAAARSVDGLARHALPRETRGGRGVTRTVHLDRHGHPQVEHWKLHGSAHVWSGGDPAGSFTEAEGPDASAEMLRFFLVR